MASVVGQLTKKKSPSSNSVNADEEDSSKDSVGGTTPVPSQRSKIMQAILDRKQAYVKNFLE